jgi:dipeptidyl aminopeptidase/acylaminoacyl peptidase
MNANGSSQTDLSSAGTDPAWSPDGTKIVFTRFTGGTDEIFVMNADGTNQTNISNNAAGHDVHAGWSPDGTKIVFARAVGSNYEIYTMNPDGTNQTNISNHADTDSDPAWSPDGTKIAFTRSDGVAEVFVMNADGTNQTNLSNNAPDHDSSPAWSPGGTKIAFQRFTNAVSDWEIYTMDADGTDQTNISNDTTYDDTDPNWSRSSGPGADFDLDGCIDAKEAGPNQALGGRRNPQNFWDFFDVPTGPSLVRNKAVAAPDFNAVLQRFGANDSGAGTFNRFSNPLTTPNAFVAGQNRENYHPAFDRGMASVAGQNWTLTAPDGAIAAVDFNRVLAQFGHNCN